MKTHGNELLEFVATYIRMLMRRSKASPICLIWIPKNAGTAVYEAYKASGAVKYKRRYMSAFFSPKYLFTFGHRLVPKKIIEKAVDYDTTFIAVLRDPIERFCSVYSYYETRGIFSQIYESWNIDFIIHELEKGAVPELDDNHHVWMSMFNPQVEWIKHYPIHRFFSQKNIAELEDYLNNHFDCSQKLQRSNTSPSQNIILTKKQRSRLLAFYKKDVELIRRYLDQE